MVIKIDIFNKNIPKLMIGIGVIQLIVYIIIINKYLTQERLKEALDKHLLSSSENAFNSYQNLKNYFAQYSYKAGLTIRELKDRRTKIKINDNY